MINSVTLKNFKCFKDRKVSLGQLSLLTGLNSAGKSTVLHALLLLRQSYDQRTLPQQGLLLNGPLLNLGTSEGLYNTHAEGNLIEFQVCDSQKNDWAFVYNGTNEDYFKVQIEPSDYSVIPWLNSHFHYISAERIGPRSSYEYSSLNVETKGSVAPDGRYTVAFLEARALSRVHPEMWHEKAIDDTLISQVTAWLGEISPGVQIRLIPESAEVQLRFGFLPAVGAVDYFDPRNVGFGVSYFLSVLVALLSAQPGSLIVVENPEAHLHSKGQVAMGTLFSRAAKSGIQVVVETHSDHFLNGVRLAVKNNILPASNVCINFFRRDTNKAATYEIETPRIDKNGRIDAWPADFFDVWDKSLDRLLE